MKQLNQLLALSTVPRWTVVPTIQKQSVAEHSFNVAVIADYYRPFIKNVHGYPFVEGVVYKAALEHDREEFATGDIPSNHKHIFRKQLDDFVSTKIGENLTPVNVRKIIKIADITEAIIFLRKERKMGNSMVDEVLTELVERGATITKDIRWIDDIDKYQELIYHPEMYRVAGMQI